jgi:dihydroorotate dehydrogenase electron transfer subunit
MCNDRQNSKGLFDAAVIRSVAVGMRNWRLALELEGEAAAAFAGARPGQFLEIDATGLSLPRRDLIPPELRDSAQRHVILRRPLSFWDVYEMDNGNTCVELLFCLVGPSTLRLATLRKGDFVNICGPLGNGFSMPEGKTHAVVVGGGIGIPPIYHFTNWLDENRDDVSVTAIVGARRLKDFPLESMQHKKKTAIEFALAGAETLVATNDGSRGFKGFVTGCLEDWLSRTDVKKEDICVFGCGPEAMLAALVKTCRANGLDCYVSLERLMACGVGLCQSCAVEKRDKSDGHKYLLCCKDGPVFNSEDIVI